MFGIDFPEVLIIFGLALVVLGPKKLPGVAAQVGRWLGRARAMARQFREQLEQEVNTVESALDTNPRPGMHSGGPGPAPQPTASESPGAAASQSPSSIGGTADPAAAAQEAMYTAHGWQVPGGPDTHRDLGAPVSDPEAHRDLGAPAADPGAHRDLGAGERPEAAHEADTAPASATRE